ncbi:glutathione S-transferase [Caulobacter sp. D4A]|uniref:glutathione S-transferase n=1 Tax=unclassified Caulobacter TaxID=2648921 RepID=UPI000D72E455|nr:MULTISPECIES: glutathione S-transferase [unclassified Caulobacter]PXA79653.1 glutathione S-transferase [Caulobacter sp. D4A]PXA82723.1 glutathione S-transferase [Caulobacter sp. D5]
MVVVHHLNNSRSQRVLWLLEELGVPYEVKRYERNLQTMLAPPELRAIHPLGKSPVITDGDKTIAETGAIIEYVLDTYGNGRLIPAAGTPERLRYTYWLHYAEGSAMTPLLLKLVFSALPARSPGLLKPLVKAIAGKAQSGFVDPQLKAHIDYWDAELAKSEWFAGSDFTAADVMMSFPLEAAASRAGANSRPRVKAFLERIHARPAYRTALERGGEYAYAD